MINKLKSNKSLCLIILCWLVYTCSYIGRLSYNSNISQIGDFYNISYSEAGKVSTFFFFVYGFGQIINGLFCKKYNIKYVIFFSLLVSSLMNILLISTPNINLMKYFWLINGAAMSFLWTSLIRLLSENLDKKDISKAIVIMGTTVACGTFIVYGLSALLAGLNMFQLTFYIAAIILIVVSLIWIFSYNKLVDINKVVQLEENEKVKIKIKDNTVVFMIIILSFFAIANNFVKDGLTAWTPDILESLYNTPGWLSILLTLLLPVLAIFGTVVAVSLNKKVKDFIGICTILYSVSLILLGIVIVFLSTPYIPITIISFSIISCLMAGVNNVITSMIPLRLKDKIASGKLAGILNSFCYLGSTLSSYGLGLIADYKGWNAVFNTLFIVNSIILLIGITYLIFKKFKLINLF